MADSKSNSETIRRYRCERCMGDIRPEVIRRTTNPLWHPRCETCRRPMIAVDRLDRFIRPKPPRPPKKKPEVSGQMSLDGSGTQ